MSLKILILGVNGFIGSHLSETILKTTDWEVYGMDLASDKLGTSIDNPRFHFVEGDITINKEWIEYHVRKCDVVLPLVAIATPAIYVSDPLRVFELDFEANLAIVRYCVRYNKRVVFPSTSEVYGMSPEEEFDEETSNLVLGPVSKQRWIYSCSKQLLDRVIHAYGLKDQLRYTLFRPFNFIGPRLDNIMAANEGSSRVLTQFLGNILRGKDIQLVDGGTQKRCFIYIDDAIAALMKIIENKDGIADKRIFNIGFPQAELSIAELAEMMLDVVSEFPGYTDVRDRVKLVAVSSGEYYGKGYQDMLVRVPSIKAIKTLGWEPTTDVRTAIRKTVEYYIDEFSVGTTGKSVESELL
ncbi:MAG: bifunctional UDP-4-keto-pentose/UDP-xylose synthase [Parvibaculum sp.]|nr:bifunctional UDP-4-keto-pentose/UDP-xylose synthase [Parvibaculum sp.]|tara:strand:- start:4582 stop:5643 length:1062 start_codon:yes stop_codon:yes gene_type:complete